MKDLKGNSIYNIILLIYYIFHILIFSKCVIILGNVLPPDHHLIKSATTALSDMQEFREKEEWKLMFEAANGWIQRNILPDTNV